MLAGCTGSFAAILYMWIKYGKPDASMAGNGLLAGLVAITAPSGYVNTRDACIIGFVGGVLVCMSVEFIDRVLRIDDPVGATSVHGAGGLFGVLSVGLFADGTNGVRGLFYGDAGQLVAQLIGIATLLGFVFPFTYAVNWVIEVLIGQRVSAEDELEGLDIPEMGALCYPEFVLKRESVPVGIAAD
jgi:Amt family ammonium transporter